MKLLGSIVLLAGLATAALAQQTAQEPAPEQAPEKPSASAPQTGPIRTVERDVKALSGRDTRLLIFTNVKADCTSGPMPTIRLVTPPANGKVAVRRGKLKATNIRNCLAIEVPALAAIYRSAADFEGSDTIVLEVRPAEGAPQLRRFTISVTKGDPGRSI